MDDRREGPGVRARRGRQIVRIPLIRSLSATIVAKDALRLLDAFGFYLDRLRDLFASDMVIAQCRDVVRACLRREDNAMAAAKPKKAKAPQFPKRIGITG